MIWNLGIVINNDGKIINHRSLLTVILNPFLRTIGVQISTEYNKRNETLGRLKLIRCKPHKLEFCFDYKLCDGCRVVRSRILI
jgi:hypothetical protein